jgi:alanine racemase
MTVLLRGREAALIPSQSRLLVRDEGRIRNSHLTLEVDLRVVRENVEVIKAEVGVPVLPVVKADAYGLGMAAISDAIADLAQGFCVFRASEALAIDLSHRTGKRVLALGPPESLDPADYTPHGITPTVCSPHQARLLRRARPALCVDTGMQRFSCLPDDCREAVSNGDCRELFTHATDLSHIEKLKELAYGFDLPRHAAASSLLHDPRAILDAVRPGLALYLRAVTLSSRIVEVHSSRGPAGYSGFIAERHGIILAGYSHGLRRGPCLINGRKSRLLEVGMQSAFVELSPIDRVGDSVVLLGGDLTEAELAKSWACSPHEVLMSLSSAATRHYIH